MTPSNMRSSSMRAHRPHGLRRCFPRHGRPQIFLRFRQGSRLDRSHRTAARQGWRYRSYLDRLRSRSEEHTSELQSLMRISYAVFCLKKKTTTTTVNLQINVLQTYTKTTYA